MNHPDPLNTFLSLRVSVPVKTAFNLKAQRYGKPSDVLRELIEAFLDDRLTVKRNPTKESLYHV